MHLYGSVASPFVQRAAMAARAKGHEIEIRVPLGGSMVSDEFRAISPMGRIPVLALDSGEHVCESAAIAGYLDETLDGPSLLPADPLDRARMREIEAVAVLEIAAAMRPMMIYRVFKRLQSDDVPAAADAQLSQGLDALARLIGDGSEPLTLADCALVPFLTLVRIVEPMTGAWSAVEQRPAIADYYARRGENPAARRSIDEMTAAFAEILARQAKPA